MKSEGIFTPPKRTDKTNKAGEEPSKRTRAIRQFFPKILASTALVAVTLTCLVGTGCVDRSDQTSRLGRKVDAVQAGPIQTYEYSPKPTVDDDGSAGDNLIPFGTSAISIIPENICVEVSENSTVICGKGIGSGNEYWRFGVEDAEIPLPDGSRVPILDGHVYVAMRNGLFIKICADTGEEVRRVLYDVKFDSQAKVTSQPEGNIITITIGRGIYSIDSDCKLTLLGAVAAK